MKDVRIRDYNLPRKGDRPATPFSATFQCRDGFSVDETSLGRPQPMVKTPRTDKREARLFDEMPPTPSSIETRGSGSARGSPILGEECSAAPETRLMNDSKLEC